MAVATRQTSPASNPALNTRPAALALAVASALIGAPLGAFALPTGGEVAAGQATISQPTATSLQIDQGTAKAILNWQFVSAIDFWSLLLSRSCDLESERQAGVESPLKPLVYPLVQVATGVVGLVPNSRYFPYRLHLLKSMMRPHR